MIKDFTPTPEQISLHGLGFIQVKLPNDQRLHVWHPDLPRRSCYHYSAIHNHRFSFASQVMIGTQRNQRYILDLDQSGDWDIISHNGPRSEKGGRVSYVYGRANAIPNGAVEVYGPGDTYHMDELEFHQTPNSGIVVTLMTKLTEGKVHACSVIRHGHEFDQSFDRFQLPAERLWLYVIDAFKAGES